MSVYFVLVRVSTSYLFFLCFFLLGCLDLKFHPWLTRSRREQQLREDGLHQHVQDPQNLITNKNLLLQISYFLSYSFVLIFPSLMPFQVLRFEDKCFKNG